MSFSRNLAALRRGRGVSQRVAAADLGVSQALLSHYENGLREPGLQFLCAVADYYDCTLDYLLGRAKDAKPVGPSAEELLPALISALESACAPWPQTAELLGEAKRSLEKEKQDG